MRSHLLSGVRMFLTVAAMAAAGWSQQDASESCTGCHEQKVTGAHQSVGCARCHLKHEEYPHPENAPKPACASCHDAIAKQDAAGVHGQARMTGDTAAPECTTCHGAAHDIERTKTTQFQMAMPDTCGMCHDQQASEFRASVHGKAVAAGIGEAPVCTDCHGVHGILPHSSQSSPVNPLRIRETCGSCHGDVRLSRRFGLPADRVLSFDASFHGLASASGSQTVANCASCHGFHNILSSADSKSMTHASNLGTTCGKCHPGAGSRFALGPMHSWEGRGESKYVGWVRSTYYLLIPLTLGLMFLHNAGDYLRKLWNRRIDRVAQTHISLVGSLRMLPFERFQHALLVISFGLLVWTGFALKYPDQWWARPLLAWEANVSFRGIVHRVAAVVFTIVTVIHLVSLFVSTRLREHWKEMLPRRADVYEGLGWMGYNLGLRRTQPPRSAHSYIEKAEYWAVVWGALVMAATGFMLWANNLMLQLLPKWALDVATAIHFYEAVLATAAIVVWHFYFVIFDPDVYPMDLAWLTGRSVRKHEHHGHQPASGD